MISGTFLILCAITFATCFYLIIKKKQDWTKCPPGPTRFPLVGNILQLGQPKVMYQKYYKWAERYGDIFRLDLANKKTVVISDHKLLKQIFSEPDFSGRMELKLYDVVPDSHVQHGIALTDGKHWEELRRFSIKQLKDFGFMKMEDSIMMEVNELLDILKQEENKPISNIRDKLLIAVVNSVWAIISGKRYSQNDKALLRMTENTFTATAKSSILVLLPFLKDIIPEYSGYNIMRKAIKTFIDFFEESIDEHKKSFDETHNRDFIDSFISEIRKTENKESAFYGKLGEDNLVATMNDLWFAGTDTSSSTLGWLILCLSQNPEIQEKMQREITAITGNTRSVSVADRPKMPYTEAVISETLRYSSLIPLGIHHRCLKDSEIRGFKIPKDCLITPNLFYIHHNPQVWGDPENFRPERFLSPDGKTFKKHEALIPFSVGRRVCLGQNLGMDSVFLFATNIFQRFDIEFEKYVPDEGVGSIEGFVRSVEPYSVICRDRF